MSLEKAQAEPNWANVKYGPIDYQEIVYYSAPKQKPGLASLEELDPEILRAYEKLGIPLAEQKHLAGVAVDAISTASPSLRPSKREAGRAGIIFCSSRKPLQEHPGLVPRYLGSSGALADRQLLRHARLRRVQRWVSFVLCAKGGIAARSSFPAYFRIDAANTGQFDAP